MAGGVLIDASRSDDGGEVVRTALTMSLLTGRPVRLVRIRESSPSSGPPSRTPRPPPGLREVDLAYVRAAARISDARVGGAEPGSPDLFFQPHGVRPGEHDIRLGPGHPCVVGVLTLALPLAMADGPSRLRIAGATHVPGAPSFEILEHDWLPFMTQLGVSIRLKPERLAFGPNSEGQLLALIGGGARPTPLDTRLRANLQSLAGMVFVARVPREIGNRMARELRRQLRRAGVSVRVDLVVLEGEGQGMGARLEAVLEGGDRVGFGTLESGTGSASVERSARRLANSLFDWLDTGAALPAFLAEELIVPLAAAVARGPSVYTTSRITPRLLARAGIVRDFLPIRVEVTGRPNEPGEVRLGRRA